VCGITHYGWWSALEFLVIVMGAISVYFTLGYDTENRIIETNFSATKLWIMWPYTIALAFGIMAHIVHVILFVLEFVDNKTVLVTQFQWAAIILIILLATDLLLEAWLVYRVYVFRKHLDMAFYDTGKPLLVLGVTPKEGSSEAAPVKELLRSSATPALANLNLRASRFYHK
jgi:hypothetical protein